MSDLADFIDTYTLSVADVAACLDVAGLKGQQLFNAMAVAGGQTTSTAPIALADMDQVYILADAADVDAVIKADALRSHPFLDMALSLAAA
jgi:hypothetical protein